MSKVQLKLVAGKTYACPAFKEGFIQRGDVVTVDENVAKTLLEDGYYDPSNNFHRYFKKVGEEQAKQPAEDEKPEGEDNGGEGSNDQGDSEEEEDPDEGGPNAKKPAAQASKRVARTSR